MKNQYAVRSKVVVPALLAGFLAMSGFSYGVGNGMFDSSAAVATSVAENVVASADTIDNEAAVGSATFHKFSYTGAVDKGVYGAEIKIFPQGKVPIVEVTLSSSAAEITKLKNLASSSALAYVTYDVYPAQVGPNNTGAASTLPIFSSVRKIPMVSVGTKLVGTIKFDFAINLLPSVMYTVKLRATAIDSSFSIPSYVYLNISNEYSMCQLKG